MPKIVDGEREVGRDAVVFVQSPRGSCSGTLIGDRVVLTAKHCVQSPGAPEPFGAADINVGVGSDVMSADMEFFPVTEVISAPGIYYDTEGEGVRDLLPNDLALLTLQYSPGIRPLGLSFSKPSLFAGIWTTAVGFGYTPGRFIAGTKMSVRTRLNSVDDLALYVSRTVCPGDSGGPLISEDQVVVGVVSLGTGEVCGDGLGLYNPIDVHRDLIVEVLARAGDIPGKCVESGAEICDGRDNDCDGHVDEGCLAPGDACEFDYECAGSRCDDTSAGRICTQSCDAMTPGSSCPAGLRCEGDESCRGVCVPGGPGPKMHGEDCSDDIECASLLCSDSGDGRMACATPCRGGTDSCFGGEACSARPGACGGCVQARMKSGALRFGEPCDAPDRCRSGLCVEDSGLSYCSDVCELNDDCAEGAHCRAGSCVRGAPAELGGTCVSTDDCSKEMFCKVSGSEGFCARYCVSSSDCGAGFSCERIPTGSACMPERRLLGAACAHDAECGSNLCDGASGTCSLACSNNAMCGSGFECVRNDSSQLSGLCLIGGPLLVDAPKAGGCRAVQGRGAGQGLYLLGAMLGLLWWRHRAASARSWKRRARAPGSGERAGFASRAALAMVPRMTRWAHLTVATGLAVAGAAGCDSLSDFNGTYEGAIIDGNFVRRCFDTEVTATLEFRAEAAVAVTEFPMPLNTLSTDDGTFDETPLVPFAAVPHDQLDELDFPGPSRVRNFMLSATPDSGPLAGRDAMVVVSILEKGTVEVRVMAHTADSAPPCAPPPPEGADDDSDNLAVNPHEYFGVFQLKEK